MEGESEHSGSEGGRRALLLRVQHVQALWQGVVREGARQRRHGHAEPRHDPQPAHGGRARPRRGHLRAGAPRRPLPRRQGRAGEGGFPERGRLAAADRPRHHQGRPEPGGDEAVRRLADQPRRPEGGEPPRPFLAAQGFHQRRGRRSLEAALPLVGRRRAGSLPRPMDVRGAQDSQLRDPMKKSAALRKLLKKKEFVYMPVAYDALGGRLLESLGFDCVYTGGFVTGGSRCTSEPMLTMDEQIRTAADVAAAIEIPLVVDGGAGFGEPLHTMRTVRECIRAGIAGTHIEDQLYPKRAHYHKYVAHAVERQEFIDKIVFACTDTCRFMGLKEAAWRINAAADAGADMGLLFPRNDEEMKKAPKQCKIPLVYVISRGNRDGRPLPSGPQLADMGYKAAIDALTYLLASFHFAKRAYQEIKRTGGYSGLTPKQCVEARQEIETLVGLDEFYEVEEATVEKK